MAESSEQVAPPRPGASMAIGTRRRKVGTERLELGEVVLLVGARQPGPSGPRVSRGPRASRSRRSAT